MTDLANKMTAIAHGGYKREDVIRHIAQGQKQRNERLDKEPVIADINDVIKHLTLDTLCELYAHVLFLRTREHL